MGAANLGEYVDTAKILLLSDSMVIERKTPFSDFVTMREGCVDRWKTCPSHADTVVYCTWKIVYSTLLGVLYTC